jgi:hypothetical protein
MTPDMICPICGSLLSAVTLTCVRGEYCKPPGHFRESPHERARRLRDASKPYPETRDVKTIRADLRTLRVEMLSLGIKKTSPFNGGMDRETQRCNERRFALETELAMWQPTNPGPSDPWNNADCRG